MHVAGGTRDEGRITNSFLSFCDYDNGIIGYRMVQIVTEIMGCAIPR